MLEFSRGLALNLFLNKERRGGYFINKDEDFNIEGLSISDIDHQNRRMSIFERKAQSLLNRNAEGQYKFSHKSILEYFLANEIIKKRLFHSSFDFSGMNISRSFFQEIIVDTLKNIEGRFSIDKNDFVYSGEAF